ARSRSAVADAVGDVARGLLALGLRQPFAPAPAKLQSRTSIDPRRQDPMNSIKLTIIASTALAVSFALGCEEEAQAPVEEATQPNLAPAKPDRASKSQAAPAAPRAAMPPMSRGPMFDQMRASCPMTVADAKVVVTD